MDLHNHSSAHSSSQAGLSELVEVRRHRHAPPHRPLPLLPHVLLLLPPRPLLHLHLLRPHPSPRPRPHPRPRPRPLEPP